jgi:hypothetical protein
MDNLHARRSERISIAIPVDITGAEPAGDKFTAQAKTALISRHGATVVINRKLIADQQVYLSRPQVGKIATGRVVGYIRRQSDGEVYGIELDEKDVGFWDVEFAAPGAHEEAVAKILLECTICHSREVACLNELEIEVYEANRSIMLRCRHCENSTLWSLAQYDVGGGPVSAAAKPAGAPAAPAAPKARTSNDRKHIRMKVKMTACIRMIGFDDDVVEIENMSRGGLCFKSKKRYPKGSRIDVALPYTLGGANIFVPARVVYVAEIPAERVSRYGVAYIPAN